MVQKHHAATAESDGRLGGTAWHESLSTQPLKFGVEIVRLETQVIQAAPTISQSSTDWRIITQGRNQLNAPAVIFGEAQAHPLDRVLDDWTNLGAKRVAKQGDRRLQVGNREAGVIETSPSHADITVSAEVRSVSHAGVSIA